MGFIFRVFVCFFCLMSNVWSQECDSSRQLSIDVTNYFINSDGTVTDLDSGLTWMRCSVGQKWRGNACTGQANTFNWREAFSQEDEINRLESNRWRLPTLSELATIVERQCWAPRINLELFPQTPSVAYWSANHKKGSENAFAMDFNKHGLQSLPKERRLYLRMVRGRN